MWQLAVLGSILSGNFIASVFIHELGKTNPFERGRNLVLQYLCMLGLSICVWLWQGAHALPVSALAIAVSGSAVTLGTYLQWRAFGISTSMSAFIPTVTNVLAFGLSALFFSEWHQLVEPIRFIGVVLVSAGIAAYFTRTQHTTHGIPFSFLWHALPAAIIFGITTFLMNIWAKDAVTVIEFVIAWYSGAFLGSCLLFAFLLTKPHETIPSVKSRTALLIVGSAISGFMSSALGFLSFALVGQALTLPLYAVGGILGPVVVGFAVFREWTQVRGVEWLYLGIALVGAFMLALFS